MATAKKAATAASESETNIDVAVQQHGFSGKTCEIKSLFTVNIGHLCRLPAEQCAHAFIAGVEYAL